MSQRYIIGESSDQTRQVASDDNFIGGVPKLPAAEPLPSCKLCNAEQTFFFQIRLPGDHPWDGFSLAVFACTSCADEDHLIPEMLSGTLRGIEIPTGFLEDYQSNFRFLAIPWDGSPRETYVEKVRFKRLELRPSQDPPASANYVGDTPTWVLGDESPGRYAGKTAMVFLLQLRQGLEFQTLQSAPPQVVLGLSGEPEASTESYYQLFLGNALYVFGTVGLAKPLVYAVTQVD
jgi:hypothetical protein